MKLESLDIANYFITDLPLSLGTLGNLEQLRLENNKIRTPPAEIVAGGLPAILAYLRYVTQ